MLNKIKFKNYKSFKNQQELELKPMTVVIGKNNSGKSSVVKLPTLIENSLEGKFPEPLLLMNNGVELGSEFKDLVFGRTRTGSLSLGLQDDHETLDLTIASETGTNDLPKIFSWKLQNSSGQFQKDDKNLFKGFKPQDQEGDCVIKSLQLNTEYIGPFRALPERGYTRPNTYTINKLGITGENAYQLLIQNSLTREQPLIKKISNWCRNNFEGWELKVNQDKDPFFQIELTRDSGALNINLKDVGQGISQALPLITRAYMPASDEILIIIEQPELHLHPSAHGDLAELFVNSVKEGNKRYLIETHSQNFILRLRRLVAEKKFDQEHLLIYFVDFDDENGTSNLIKIEVDELGEVNHWPENVFNESLDEALAIRIAQKKKTV